MSTDKHKEIKVFGNDTNTGTLLLSRTNLEFHSIKENFIYNKKIIELKDNIGDELCCLYPFIYFTVQDRIKIVR